MAKKSKPEPEEGAPEEEAKSGGMMGTILLVVAALAGSFGANYLFAPSAPEHVEVAECTPADPVDKPLPKRAKVDQEFVELEEILITIGSSFG